VLHAWDRHGYPLPIRGGGCTHYFVWFSLCVALRSHERPLTHTPWSHHTHQTLHTLHYTGAGLAYNLANAVIGGSAAFLQTALVLSGTPSWDQYSSWSAEDEEYSSKYGNNNNTTTTTTTTAEGSFNSTNAYSYSYFINSLASHSSHSSSRYDYGYTSSNSNSNGLNSKGNSTVTHPRDSKSASVLGDMALSVGNAMSRILSTQWEHMNEFSQRCQVSSGISLGLGLGLSLGLGLGLSLGLSLSLSLGFMGVFLYILFVSHKNAWCSYLTVHYNKISLHSIQP